MERTGGALALHTTWGRATMDVRASSSTRISRGHTKPDNPSAVPYDQQPRRRIRRWCADGHCLLGDACARIHGEPTEAVATCMRVLPTPMRR